MLWGVNSMIVSPDNRASPTSLAPPAELIDALNRQAWDARTTDAQAAIALGEQARALAAEYGERPRLARSHFILGHCHYRIAEYEAARTHSLAALTLFEELGDRDGRADALNTIGNVYSSLGDHHSALDYYLQSLALRQAAGNRQSEAASLNNIGNVYFHLADYPNALDAHLGSLAIKEAIGDRPGIGVSLHNIANIYQEMGEYQSALERYSASLAIFQELGNTYGEAGALSNIGAVHAARGDIPLARDYYAQSLAIERRTGNRHGEAESLLQLGELYLPAGTAMRAQEQSADSLQVALSHLQPALALAQELEANELCYKIHLALSRAYQHLGDYAAALGHHQSFHTLQRAVFDEELSKKTKQLQIIHQVENSKREAALQRAEAELVRLKNVELAAALADTQHHRQVAEQASQLKTDLLSIAAHDLKNPLSAIIGYIELLRDQERPDWPWRDVATNITITARQMLQIITDLLESAMITAGNLNLNVRPIDLGDLAALVVERSRPQATHKAQALHFRADPGCVVMADEPRIQEIVDNLLSNAIKYSPHARSIWVSVTRNDPWICLAVQDQGPGLTAEDQQRLFGRFARLSAQPTGGEHATGLGLSIVKLLVELHNGRVWAESAGPDAGSTFFVELPAAAEG